MTSAAIESTNARVTSSAVTTVSTAIADGSRPAVSQKPAASASALTTTNSIAAPEVPFRDEHGEFILDFVDGGDIMAWVSQGAIADRTRERLGETDRGIALYRRMLLEQLDVVTAGGDPLGIVRDPAENEMIELPQERHKYGRGSAFLREAIEMSHVRYSPIREHIIEVLSRPA